MKNATPAAPATTLDTTTDRHFDLEVQDINGKDEVAPSALYVYACCCCCCA